MVTRIKNHFACPWSIFTLNILFHGLNLERKMFFVQRITALTNCNSEASRLHGFALVSDPVRCDDVMYVCYRALSECMF